MFIVTLRTRFCKDNQEKKFSVESGNHKDAWQWGKAQCKQLGFGWHVVSAEAKQAVRDGLKLELK